VTAPALYEADIRHVRVTPVRNAFAYRSYYWYVDLADLPRLRWPLRMLAGFDARDHFDGAGGLRAGLDALLAGHGIDLRGGRVTMLAHARVFGYVFNPLSVYWCHDEQGRLACVVAEVHNTYGQRHSYVLRPEAGAGARLEGRDGPELRTGKEFYVSPFFDVSGSYRMRLPVPDDRLALTISLRRDGERPFVATVRGTRRTATATALIRAAARHPWSTLVGSALIRFQGIRLYRKGLPVVPRPGLCPHTSTTQPAKEKTL
jgi:DUF1365 family protein